MLDSTPLLDPGLSLRARGIWGIFMAHGRALSAAELYPLVREGRDAIRKAIRELVDSGYIVENRYHTQNGQFAYELEVAQAWFTRAGFSGGLLGETVLVDSNSYITQIELTNVSSISVSGTPESEGEFVEMAWPGFEEEDKAAKRQAKYKKTSFEAVPASMRRAERPEEEWTTADLVAEFYDLTREHAPGVPSQVNGKSLASWINQKVGEGIPRTAVLRALRAFFNDPRLLRDPGVGKPLWRRFVAFYPTVHGLYARGDKVTYDDPEFDNHAAKMARLLED